MIGLSLNKSSILKLKPQDSGWAIKAPRPGKLAATIKSPKAKEKTDCGQQMVSAFALKRTFLLKNTTTEGKNGIGHINSRLDQVLFNSKRTASIGEARQQIRKGVLINGLIASPSSRVPTFAVIKDNSPLMTRPVAHAIKNVYPTYPHLVRIDNETLLNLREREGMFKPKQLETARLNRLTKKQRAA
jgi:hypothetical protein